jgi:L-lactate utilization protein LutB
MASTSTTGGGLHFDATIKDTDFNATINRMNDNVNNMTNNVVAQGSKVEEYAKKVSDANSGILERLKIKLAEFKSSADSSMSVAGIEKYNAKIQEFD